MALVPRFSAGNQNPIGMVVQSMLTEPQFQAINGTSWILADGRSVAGTQYATTTGNSTAPDLRGQTLRGKNNGRADGNQDSAGERTLGSFQQTGVPNITGSISSGPGGGWGGFVSNSGSVAATTSGNFQGWASQSRSGFIYGFNFDASVSSGVYTNGITEARVRNVAVNHFIKVNP